MPWPYISVHCFLFQNSLTECSWSGRSTESQNTPWKVPDSLMSCLLYHRSQILLESVYPLHVGSCHNTISQQIIRLNYVTLQGGLFWSGMPSEPWNKGKSINKMFLGNAGSFFPARQPILHPRAADQIGKNNCGQREITKRYAKYQRYGATVVWLVGIWEVYTCGNHACFAFAEMITTNEIDYEVQPTRARLNESLRSCWSRVITYTYYKVFWNFAIISRLV